jgi:putative colanic acid biosynthesis acetyltransferase WcaF
MEEDSCIADGVICYNVCDIRIGRGATVSQYTHLCTASHNFDSPVHQLIGAPILIGAGAWVAADAFVGPGVEIGENAVVLARSVVVRNVPAGMVVAGHPAKVLRRRGEGVRATQC